MAIIVPVYVAEGATTLGAVQTDYGQSDVASHKCMEAMIEEGQEFVAEPVMPEKDTSSDTGSSGWSSSAATSSLNTGSIDDSSDIAANAGATLARLGLPSATFRQQQQKAAAKSSDNETSGDDDESKEEDNKEDRRIKRYVRLIDENCT
jgi:hypothetical protein